MPTDGRVKYDWYQNETHVMVGVLIKNLVADETRVVYEPTVASASLKLPDGSDYSLQLILAHPIDPSTSSFRVSQVKLELKMAKAHPGPWTDLEAAPNVEAEEAAENVTRVDDGNTADRVAADEITADRVAADGITADRVAADGITADGNTADGISDQPVVLSATNGASAADRVGKVEATKPAARSAKNWDKIAKEIEEEEKNSEEGNVDDFFKKLYEGADPDARRAMVKSMQESGGTVLSTNWSEVGKNKVEVKPPDGCEFKKWD